MEVTVEPLLFVSVNVSGLSALVTPMGEEANVWFVGVSVTLLRAGGCCW